MAQFLRPDSNVTQTDFTGGFAEIDDSVASDADTAFGELPLFFLRPALVDGSAREVHDHIAAFEIHSVRLHPTRNSRHIAVPFPAHADHLQALVCQHFRQPAADESARPVDDRQFSHGARYTLRGRGKTAFRKAPSAPLPARRGNERPRPAAEMACPRSGIPPPPAARGKCRARSPDEPAPPSSAGSRKI